MRQSTFLMLLVRRFDGEDGGTHSNAREAFFLSRMTELELFEILISDGVTNIFESNKLLLLDCRLEEDSRVRTPEWFIEVYDNMLLDMNHEKRAISQNGPWVRYKEWRDQTTGQIVNRLPITKTDDELTEEENREKRERIESIERKTAVVQRRGGAYSQLIERHKAFRLILPINLIQGGAGSIQESKTTASHPITTTKSRTRRTRERLNELTPLIVTAYHELYGTGKQSTVDVFKTLEQKSEALFGERLTAGQIRGIYDRKEKFM